MEAVRREKIPHSSSDKKDLNEEDQDRKVLIREQVLEAIQSIKIPSEE